jgi:hypothetical protein
MGMLGRGWRIITGYPATGRGVAGEVWGSSLFWWKSDWKPEMRLKKLEFEM